MERQLSEYPTIKTTIFPLLRSMFSLFLRILEIKLLLSTQLTLKMEASLTTLLVPIPLILSKTLVLMILFMELTQQATFASMVSPIYFSIAQ